MISHLSQGVAHLAFDPTSYVIVVVLGCSDYCMMLAACI